MRFFTILLMSVCALMSSLRAIADDALSTLIGDDKVWNYHTNIYDQENLSTTMTLTLSIATEL